MTGIPHDPSLFPKTRYQGSKRKLVPWIGSILSQLDFESAIDLMSGTGTIGYLLKSMGKEVTVNDYLQFNYLTGLALVENAKTRIDNDDLKDLFKKRSDVNYQSCIASNFKGYYFTNSENRWLDVVVQNIHASFSNRGNEKKKKAILLHALFQACMMKRPYNLFHRKNLYMRTATVDRSFGNKTTWETPFRELFLRSVEEANEKIFDNKQNNRALNSDAMDVDTSSYDLVYLDPPYFYVNGSYRKTDYRKLYHFLEGLARYESWEELIDKDTILRELKHRDSSIDALYKCSRHELEANVERWFTEIISNCRNSTIVLSYKDPGIPSVYKLKKILRSFNKTVRLKNKPYTYALHAEHNSQSNKEIILIAE